MIDELVETLKEPIKELQELQNYLLKITQKEVEYIIKNKIEKEQEVEEVFDKLLNLTYWYGEEVKDTFYKLLNYYKPINEESSRFYEKYYLEIINEDDEDIY